MAHWMIESPFTEPGRWKSGEIRPLIADKETVGGGFCSACKTPALFTEYGINTAYSRYCPNCGAFMENWQGEELSNAISEMEAAIADAYWAKKRQDEQDKQVRTDDRTA